MASRRAIAERENRNMWLHHGIIALDLARERTRELELAAEHYRLLREGGDFETHLRPPRPSRLRALLARPVRAFSNLTHVIADAACTAATRIEGRTA
jgi:hypothetical protein